MCLIAAQVGLAAAQAGMQIRQQRQQQQYEEEGHAINQVLAQRDAIRTFEQNAKREQQEVQAAASSISRTTREAQQAQGLARAVAPTTAGADFAALLGDFEKQRLQSVTDTKTNLAFTRDQIATANEGVTDAQFSRVLSTTPTTQPDYLGALFRIGAAGLDAYTNSPGRDRPDGREQFTYQPTRPRNFRLFD